MATATSPSTDSSVPEARLDAVFSALGNRTRRALVARLGHGDATTSELAEPFDMTLAAVSKHLQVLERAGLVVRTPQGKATRCSLDLDTVSETETWLRSRREMWEQSLDAFAAHVEKRQTDDDQRGGR